MDTGAVPVYFTLNGMRFGVRPGSDPFSVAMSWIDMTIEVEFGEGLYDQFRRVNLLPREKSNLGLACISLFTGPRMATRGVQSIAKPSDGEILVACCAEFYKKSWKAALCPARHRRYCELCIAPDLPRLRYLSVPVHSETLE